MKLLDIWYWVVCLVAAANALTAQTQIDLKKQARNVDFSHAESTKPFRTGVGLPQTCVMGEAYLRTDGAAGLYVCTAPNAWTQTQGTGTSSGGLVTVPFSATPVFDASLGSIQKLTLRGHVTGATLTGVVTGQMLTFLICQDTTGGWQFQWPANMAGAQAVPTAPNACLRQMFVHDGTLAVGIGAGPGEPYLVASSAASAPNASVLTQGYGISLSCLPGGNCVVSAIDMTHYCASAASAGANYACNLSPAPQGLSTGMSYYFVADHPNAGPCTVNFNSLGAKPIKTSNGDDPPPGMIASGAVIQLVYDGTKMQIINAGGTVQSVGAAAPLVSTGGQNPTIQANLTGAGDKMVAKQTGSNPAVNDCAKWISDGSGGVVLSTAGAACGTSSLPGSAPNLVLAGGPQFGDAAAVVAPRALVPEDLPAMAAVYQDNQIIKGPVDAAGIPSHLQATSGLGVGCGGACSVTINGSGMPLEMFIGGKYQKLAGSVTVPLTGNAVNYIFALRDTAHATMTAADFIASTYAPFHQYSIPTCPGSGVSGANPSYWLDLGAGEMKVCTSNGGAYVTANPPAILCGTAFVSGAPAVLGVAGEPHRLSPFRRRELFGEGEDEGGANPAVITGAVVWNGVMRRRGVVVNGGSIAPLSLDQRGLGLHIISPLPVLVMGNGSINADGAGEFGSCYGTTTGTAGNRAYGPGGGAGGGGFGTTNGGGGGPKMAFHFALSSSGQGGSGGSGGVAGSPTGAAGSDFQVTSNAGAFPASVGSYVDRLIPTTGASGGCGGGDGSSTGGQGGAGGGFLTVTSPAVMIAAGGRISADGGSGAMPPAGNTGGGGGGGGGLVVVYSGYLTNGAGAVPLSSLTANGGSGGTGRGSGAAGGAGGRGVSQFVRIW